MVVRGFEQTQGIDFDETYAPVSKSTTLRLLFGKAALYNWPLTRMDVENTFLNLKVDRDNLYIVLPRGLQDFTLACMVRLVKALYVLRQYSRLWYEDINVTLLSMNIQPSNEDMNLYIGQGVFVGVLLPACRSPSPSTAHDAGSRSPPCAVAVTAFPQLYVSSIMRFSGFLLFLPSIESSIFHLSRFVLFVMSRCVLLSLRSLQQTSCLNSAEWTGCIIFMIL
jgi:hypothetical protein